MCYVSTMYRGLQGNMCLYITLSQHITARIKTRLKISFFLSVTQQAVVYSYFRFDFQFHFHF